ncbi:hypothetical protein ASD06_10310 [Angustibacter sp. Root456]|nr:hypothetical protein ASD06_10310 [Angustibacter sp. Root456]
MRAALMDHARAEGDELVRAARREADELISRADGEARALAARAAAEGQADAAAALAADQARSRRRARGVVLAAQARAYRALREQVRAEARQLADSAGWSRWCDALEILARQALQPASYDPQVERLPDGVRATSGTRSITVTLADLADAAVDELGADVEELWRP